MNLLLPIVLMIAILFSAIALGAAMRGHDLKTQQIAGGIGVLVLFLLPLVYDGWTFDGNCYGTDGTKFDCSLGARLLMSFQAGIAFMLAPALLWVLAYTWSLGMVGGSTSQK
jgi:hypothetical protein